MQFHDLHVDAAGSPVPFLLIVDEHVRVVVHSRPRERTDLFERLSDRRLRVQVLL